MFMNFYATLNRADNSISSIMSTTHLDSAYAAKNGLVEVSSEDAAIIEKYLPTHDIVLDPVEGLMVYERVGQKIDNAKTQLKALLTSTIASGFAFEGNLFSCSIYDQVNVYHFENNSESSYATVDDKTITISKDKMAAFKAAMSYHVFTLYRSHLGFKQKLELCSTFKDVDIIVNSVKVFYDGYKKNRNNAVASYASSNTAAVEITVAPTITATVETTVEASATPTLAISEPSSVPETTSADETIATSPAPEDHSQG
jgi:hypothetical protein